ncbi:ArsR/SmtB family transcription factor [Aurantimonas endophytica]|uniref:DNA-binding transcriptional ArsR family regulator n=1 Tax=Aurantimonas endophytica TaxID=1522175 RepID=A0A7W6HFH8_9HYPH|nr:metalloregulator ArsR/SmtB family transcription factor [Aurantimonas endophytica]MBB4004147.1 DNA-binding transcriptional ArsR family regulator [Aurantimonas endophytica]MCO6404990.1 metalloregulator ArsR/SmtB family transcription factor [Aurantimonas endophytica]
MVDLDATFVALSDPTRRAMLAALSDGEKSIGELAAPHAMSFAGAAKHVAVLTKAGLVARRKVGRQQLCRLRPGPLRDADAWLRQWEGFWTTQLDALEEALKEKPQ